MSIETPGRPGQGACAHLVTVKSALRPYKRGVQLDSLALDGALERLDRRR
jgi:hypothetical protein